MSVGIGRVRPRAEVYCLGGEPGMPEHRDVKLRLDAKSDRDASHALEGGGFAVADASQGAIVTLSAQLGLTDVWSWSMTVKSHLNLRRIIATGDWLDLIAESVIGDQAFFTGKIDAVEKDRGALDAGAYETTWLLAGRGWGAMFADTLIQFDVLTDGVHAASLMQEVAFGQNLIVDNPAKVVEGVLAGFLRQQRGLGRSMYERPSSMPGAADAIVDNVAFFDRGYSGFLRAYAPIDFSFLASPNTDILTFARSWSEPALHELYFDHLVAPGLGQPTAAADEAAAGTALTLKAASDSKGEKIGFDPQGPLEFYPAATPVEPFQLKMGIVFRDRPWLDSSAVGPSAYHPYLNLPTVTVPAAETVRGVFLSHERLRLNCFFVSNMLVQGDEKAFLEASGQFWNTESMRRHGLRRHTTQSAYLPNPVTTDVAAQLTAYRKRLVDLNCMNHLLTQGPLVLPSARVDIRPGMRLVIPDGPDGPESFYVEAAEHYYGNYDTGMTTKLTLSHGFEGTDDELLAAFFEIVEGFTAIDTRGEERPLTGVNPILDALDSLGPVF